MRLPEVPVSELEKMLGCGVGCGLVVDAHPRCGGSTQLGEPVWAGLVDDDQWQPADDDRTQQRVVVGNRGGDQPLDHGIGDDRGAALMVR